MASSSNDAGKGKSIAEERESEREFLYKDELQLEFVFNVGHVKDFELSMPYRAQLTNDKWNLFLRVPFFEEILLQFLKEDEDVKEGLPVTVYDKGGHEFPMMLKKFDKDSVTYYVLNRGWFNFCDQKRLQENDVVALRTFRHAITDKLSIVVTYTKMRPQPQLPTLYNAMVMPETQHNHQFRYQVLGKKFIVS
ncbi:unnamed protein product [Sphenostylis stenocarpa]|uniref:TF-B3 domain-containing protein n=1 Tax=Sphenostylis stenocarpa TaxID=92480 RepID=A0AA86SNH2_9FABA|nr:unnamed protein product [Sphenostylis stenocarpa]